MQQHTATQRHQNNAAGIEKLVHMCDMCNYSTKFKSQMEQHMLTKKHRDAMGGTTELQTIFRCEECDYTTEFKHHLEQHNKTQKHKNKTTGINEALTLQCEKCNYTASSKALFEQHNKTKKHTSEKIVNEEK
jgi:hypothetical protein